METIVEFQIVDHGIEHSQYFQGCGVSFTSFSNVATGVGNNFAEAIDDCLEQIASMGYDSEGMEKRILAVIGRKVMPTRPRIGSKHNEECYYRVSIRWNAAASSEVN